MAPNDPTHDPLAQAVKAVEDKAEGEPSPISRVTLTFNDDGGLLMASAGELRPTVLWAMSEYLRAVADDLFGSAVRANREQRLAKQPQIVVPQSGLRRIG